MRMSIVSRARHLGRFDALALTSLIWFLGKFVRFSFPPLFGTLQSLYGVSNAALGTAFTGLLFVYALMQFPSGLIADHLGPIKVIASGAFLTAVCALVLVVDSPFLILAGMMAVIGAGTGVHKTVAIGLLSRTYSERTGLALGVFDTFGTAAGVAAPAAVVLFSGLPGIFGAGWRTLFLCAGLLGLGLAVAFAVQVPKRLPDESGVATEFGSVGRISLREYVGIFRDRGFSVFVFMALLISFGYNGIIAFLPLYLTNEAGFAAGTANFLYGALFATGPVQLVTGEVSDRIGMLPVISLTLGLMAVAVVGLVGLTGTAGVVVMGAAVVCLGLGGNGFRPVRGAYLISVLPSSISGGSLGVVRTLQMAAGAFAPAIIGVLSEVIGFRSTFWLIASVLVLATLIAGVLWLLD